jgi:hypothetical protein
MKIPISVPQFRYYDEFVMNYKFSEGPKYEAGNL